MTKPITLEQLFRYKKPWGELPHQDAAIKELEEDLSTIGYEKALDRSRPWFATWSQAGKQEDLGPALDLIRKFEGCHLTAYADPLHGWNVPTIGYGTTHYTDGRKVSKGDQITPSEANQLLERQVGLIADKLSKSIPHWPLMSADQRGALLSFAYNLGSNFYGTEGFETISAKLRTKDWSDIPEALLLYRNPGTPVEEGLKRRRQAEGQLWTKGLVGLPVQQTQELPYKVKPSDPFSTRLSAHFTMGEFALGQEERRFTKQHQVDTAAELAAFLERLRTAFGNKPVVITSGYRPAAINAAVGGASSSEHLYNAPNVGAIDVYVKDADIHKVQAWCDKHWPFSIGYGANKGFVHIGIRKGRPKVRWDY